MKCGIKSIQLFVGSKAPTKKFGTSLLAFLLILFNKISLQNTSATQHFSNEDESVIHIDFCRGAKCWSYATEELNIL